MFDNEEEKPEKILKVDIAGKDSELWSDMRSKLVKSLNALLDTTLDHRTGNTVRNEAKEYTSALLRFGKEKLNKPGWENAKIEAEIEEIYTRIIKTAAEVRKTSAEAEALELNNLITKWKLVAVMTKAVFTGNEGEESIHFIKDVGVFMEALNAFNEQKQLPE